MSTPHHDEARLRRPQWLNRGLSRTLARFAVLAVAGMAVLFFNPSSAQAADCTDVEWHTNFTNCMKELPPPQSSTCKEPPVASSPDSGMAGWFANEPEWVNDPGFVNGDYSVPFGTYTAYGYAGYELPVFGQDCIGSVVPDGDTAGNSLANLEFTLTTGVIGASNGLREAAWTPGDMWGWADNFLEVASQAIYTQVFSVIGAVTLALVGLYLIWRSRQADMSMAVTTAGWAVLILVLVTAVAKWPVESATIADEGLTASLELVQDAVGPVSTEACGAGCEDPRTPAEKASDMATGEVLYQNWIRAVLGKSEEVEYKLNSDGDPIKDENGFPVVESGNIAYKYGPALFDAQALSWKDLARAREDPGVRQSIIAQKQDQWRQVAAAIEKEDPEAYMVLTGARGWDRVGTGFMALLSALFFALFDITASILILLGFLMVRWAVVAIPLIGTIAILRPASGGFKRMISMVLAALINVMIFGVAAAVYLFAVSHILAAALPGWLQVILIGLLGAVAWMLLRPYRRISSLRGGSSIADAAFGRRKSKPEESDSKPKERSGKFRAETAKEESLDARTKDSRDPIMSTQRRQDNAPGDASAGLPSRPVPGQAARSETSGGRVRPGYSVYRPSGSGSGSRTGDRPMVTVRPD